MPQFLNTADADFEQAFTALLGAKREDSPDVDAIVADIIADVRARGDAALVELTEKFDRMSLTADRLQISEAEIDAAIENVSAEERAALELAAERIRAYHARQMPAVNSGRSVICCSPERSAKVYISLATTSEVSPMVRENTWVNSNTGGAIS